MKVIVPAFLIALIGSLGQTQQHPFVPTRLSPGIDSFVLVTRVTGERPAGYVVQTLARDGNRIRLAVDYDLGPSVQRVEMMMDGRSLAPIAHWESLARRGRGDVRGEVRFSEGRARGAYILSKGVVDVPLDSGIVDDDASTALLAALPMDSVKSFAFRTFASPGKVEITRVEVGPVETVSVPAGKFEAYRLTVMARDTSNVFVSTRAPHKIVLVRTAGGASEMRLLNRLSPGAQRREES